MTVLSVLGFAGADPQAGPEAARRARLGDPGGEPGVSDQRTGAKSPVGASCR